MQYTAISPRREASSQRSDAPQSSPPMFAHSTLSLRQRQNPLQAEGCGTRGSGHEEAAEERGANASDDVLLEQAPKRA